MIGQIGDMHKDRWHQSTHT